MSHVGTPSPGGSADLMPSCYVALRLVTGAHCGEGEGGTADATYL